MGIELAILLVCFLFSVFFSVAETAYVSISRLKLSQLVERNLPAARLAKKLKEEPSKLLSIILIGNNIANIGASVLGTSLIIKMFEARGAGNLGVVLGVATGILTFIILVFGEIIPKTVAIKKAETLVLWLAWPIFIISIVLTPVAMVLTWISRPFVTLLGGKMPEKGPFLTEDDLKFMIAASEREGVIEKEEKEMISSIFEFGDTTVKEVMTPRPDIKAVEDSGAITDVVKVIRETGHSRVPVYESNIDNIIGVVYSKDLLETAPGTPIRDCLRSVIFIPEGKKVDELLHQMQANRTHIAVVVDEYGVTSGIVTMEDLIEEIVGEIHDEFERAEKNIEKAAENTYIVDAKMQIEDLNRELQVNLPTSDAYDTVAGFVFATLDKVPSVGDVLKYDNIEISVERVLKRRITRIKLTKLQRQIDDNIVGG